MAKIRRLARKALVGTGFALGRGISVFVEGWSAGFPRGGRPSDFKKFLRDSAIAESAAFFTANMSQAWIARTKQELWKSALQRSSAVGEGLILEFGVWKGDSLTWFAQHSKQEVFGFDNFFEGLQEDWAGSALPKGYFAQNQLPKVPKNATLVVGMAQEELPGFFQSHSGPIRVAHFDMDTFQSTLDVLRLVYPRLVAGSLLIFDEFFGYPLWQQGEARAWMTFVEETNIDFRYFATTGWQVGVEIV